MLLQRNPDSRHRGQPMAGDYFGGVLIEPNRFCYATFAVAGTLHEVVVFTDSLRHRGKSTYVYYDGVLRNDAEYVRDGQLDPPSRPHQAGIGVVDPDTAPDWMHAQNHFGQYDITLGDFTIAIGNRVNAVHTPDVTVPLTRINPYGDEVNIVFAQDWSSVAVEVR